MNVIIFITLIFKVFCYSKLTNIHAIIDTYTSCDDLRWWKSQVDKLPKNYPSNTFLFAMRKNGRNAGKFQPFIESCCFLGAMEQSKFGSFDKYTINGICSVWIWGLFSWERYPREMAEREITHIPVKQVMAVPE